METVEDEEHGDGVVFLPPNTQPGPGSLPLTGHQPGFALKKLAFG